MQVAVMQPYFFPYIGYFQLMSAADKFVIFDDVNYIVRGWINRNRILSNGDIIQFTLPVANQSQNKIICNHNLAENKNIWTNRFLKTVTHAYSNAPFFKQVFPVIEEIITNKEANLSDYLRYSLYRLTDFLTIETQLIGTSRNYDNAHLKGEDRIINICNQEQATSYINPAAGSQLYNPIHFQSHDIKLHFLKPNQLEYTQQTQSFTPWLSIIDIMMYDLGRLSQHLRAYQICS